MLPTAVRRSCHTQRRAVVSCEQAGCSQCTRVPCVVSLRMRASTQRGTAERENTQRTPGGNRDLKTAGATEGLMKRKQTKRAGRRPGSAAFIPSRREVVVIDLPSLRLRCPDTCSSSSLSPDEAGRDQGRSKMAERGNCGV